MHKGKQVQRTCRVILHLMLLTGKITDCFYGSEVIQWMVAVFNYSTPQARDTLKDLDTYGYLVACAQQVCVA